jgi:fibronectin-binding autotransporter adhesin
MRGASAQTATDYLGTFNSAGGAGFTTGSNWSPAAPTSNLTASIARFTQTSYANSTLTNSGYQLNGIQFGDGTTATADVTISIAGAAGQQLRVGTGGVVMRANSGNATINKLTMPQNLTITNSSANLLSIATFGVFQSNSNFTGTLNGSGRITFTGVVSNQPAAGAFTGLAALDIAGAAVTLNGANTFTGGLTLSSGSLILGNNAALGGVGNVLTITGGALDVTAARTTTNNNAQNWNGDFTFAGSNTLNLGTGAVTMNGNRTVTVNANSLTVGGAIGDGGNAYRLTKAGAGTLVLSASNAFTGGVTLSTGTLAINNNRALGSGTFTLQGGTIVNTSGSAVSVANAVSINGDFSYPMSTGATEIVINGPATLGSAAGTVRTIDASATSAGAGGLVFTGGISDGTTATSIRKIGGGQLQLNGSSSFTGGVALDAGTLMVNNTNALGTGTLTIAADTTFSVPGVTVRTVANAVVVNGDFTLGAAGKSPLTLAGPVSLGSATRTVTIGNDRGNVISGTIAGSGGLTVFASGTGVSASGTGGLTLSAVNTYTGATRIATGTVFLANVGALAASTLNLDGTDLGGVAFGVAGANTYNLGGLSGSRNLSLGANSLSVGGNGGNTSYSGILSGDGGLTKLGLGTLVVSGSNTYLGNTVVSVGALLVNGNQSSASGAVSVASGATLGGSGTLGGAVSILDGGIVAPGNSPGTLTVNNTFALAGASILNFELNAADTTVGGGINDLITGVTDLTLDGILNLSGAGDWTTVADNTSWRLFNYTGTLSGGGLTLGSTPTLADGRSFQIDTSTTGQVNVVVVPEPSAVLLALGGVAYLIGSARRRTSRRR